jgi:hypothetical protein
MSEIISWTQKWSKSIISMNGVFLHGELESLVGYDAFGVNKKFFQRLGLVGRNSAHDVQHFDLKRGVYSLMYGEQKCTLFFWRDDEGRSRGLVALNSDKKAVKHAAKHFDRNSWSL